MAQLNSNASAQAFAPGDPVWIDWAACDSIVLGPPGLTALAAM